MVNLSESEINSILEAIEAYKKSFVLSGVEEKNLNDASKKLRGAIINPTAPFRDSGGTLYGRNG